MHGIGNNHSKAIKCNKAAPTVKRNQNKRTNKNILPNSYSNETNNAFNKQVT
jgi:hypothetical protein